MLRNSKGVYSHVSGHDATLPGNAWSRPGWQRVMEGGRRVWYPFHLIDLKGKKPQGHPENIQWKTRKRPFVDVRQVWVDRFTDELLVVRELRSNQQSVRVLLGYYGRRTGIAREYSSTSTLYQKMEIWQDAVQSRRQFLRWIGDIAHASNQNLAEMACFFGRDPVTGIRTCS